MSAVGKFVGEAFNGKTTSFDPNSQGQKSLQGQQENFLSGVYSGKDPFAGATSGLQQQMFGSAGQAARGPSFGLSGYKPAQAAIAPQQGALSQMVGAPSPEQMMAGQINPQLMWMLNAQQAPQASYGGPQASYSGAQMQNAQLQQMPGSQVAYQNAQLQQMPGAYTPQMHQVQSSQFVNPMATSAYQVQPHGFNEMQFQQHQVAANPFSELGFNQFYTQNPYGGQDMAFGNPFQEMQNPYAMLGFANQGQAVSEAMLPMFDRNLRQAQGQLASQAPGRFSSAFYDQGADLGTRAIQDFNLVHQQNLMQGLQMQAQQQQQAGQFALGARQAQQGAQTDTNQANLSGRGLGQDAQLGFTGLNLQGHLGQQQGQIDARGLQQGAHLQTQQMMAQAAQDFASNKIDARQLQQTIQAQYEQMGLDSHTAAQQAALEAQQIASQAFGQQEQTRLGASSLFQQGQLDARGQDIQGIGAMNNAALQQQQQASQAFLGARGQDIQGISAMNSAMLQGASQANQFNLQNANQANQFGLQQQQLGQDQFNAQQMQQAQLMQLMQNGQLGAAGLMQQGAASQSQNDWARMQGAAQLGMQATQNQIDPRLQLMMGGMQFNQAQPTTQTHQAGWAPGLIGAGLGAVATGGVKLPKIF